MISTVWDENEKPSSLSTAITDSIKKITPENKIGSQKDLPTDKCLIARNVLRLTTHRIIATDAKETSKMRTIAIPTVTDHRNRI